MHTFFTDRKYQAQVNIERMFSWEVKYQGKKTIKSTPLFQIDFDERLLHQMRSHIKCASSARLIPLVYKSSVALQDDFSHRSIRCMDCHWCDNKKTLGPTEFIFHGETKKICWYVNSDIADLNAETTELVKEYAQMHEELEKLETA